MGHNLTPMLPQVLSSVTISPSNQQPVLSQSIGDAERGVQTVKALLKKGNQPYLALLAYITTPLLNVYRPAELSMNRKLRTNVPSSREDQKPHVPKRKLLVEREEEARRKQTATFGGHHRAQDLSPTLPGDLVCLPDMREQVIVGDEIAPRSYEVETSSSTFRRNRRDIIRLPSEDISPTRPKSHNSLILTEPLP